MFTVPEVNNLGKRQAWLLIWIRVRMELLRSTGITKGSAPNLLTAHRRPMAPVRFAVDSDSAGSSIITIAQPDETRGSI